MPPVIYSARKSSCLSLLNTDLHIVNSEVSPLPSISLVSSNLRLHLKYTVFMLTTWHAMYHTILLLVSHCPNVEGCDHEERFESNFGQLGKIVIISCVSWLHHYRSWFVLWSSYTILEKFGRDYIPRFIMRSGLHPVPSECKRVYFVVTFGGLASFMWTMWAWHNQEVIQ